mmetsp:Transcript_10848/g.12437  ORF Transcript_10848/g.12437 Transcript_10848/m.12437 type:complete len:272 (-) Transcript_10848:934-1749(-)
MPINTICRRLPFFPSLARFVKLEFSTKDSDQKLVGRTDNFFPAEDQSKVNLLSSATHTTPFDRIMLYCCRNLTPNTCSSVLLKSKSCNLQASNGSALVKTQDLIPYSSVSGVCVDMSSRYHPADLAACLKSNNPVLITFSRGKLQRDDIITSATGFRLFTISLTLATLSSTDVPAPFSIRSRLLRMITFANSIWSTIRSTTFRSSFSVTFHPLCFIFSKVEKFSRKLLISTTVTIVSSFATLVSDLPIISSYRNVCATGRGSEIPVLSMRI